MPWIYNFLRIYPSVHRRIALGVGNFLLSRMALRFGILPYKPYGNTLWYSAACNTSSQDTQRNSLKILHLKQRKNQ
jgi:hypothetical protein